MTQTLLQFDALDQRQNLSRVRSKLASHILHWLAVHAGGEFHLDDLIAYCESQGEDFTGDSVSRVMRDLKQRGQASYALVSRSKSLYRAGESYGT